MFFLYFCCLPDSYENYFFSQILEEEFGYTLFGIAASTLAFYRTEPINEALIKN